MVPDDHNVLGDKSSSREAEVQKVRNFHIRATGQDLSVAEPWGILVDEPGSIDGINLDKAGMKPLHGSGPGCWRRLSHFREPYYQAAPGVDVVYW